MKLHLPKALFTAVLAAFAIGGMAQATQYPVSDSITADTTYPENGDHHLIYDKTDSDGVITYNGAITLNGAAVWTGPGTTTDTSASAGQIGDDKATLVQLGGVITGTNTLKLNEWGGNVVYKLTNAGNTFSGTVLVDHGGAANDIVQLSLNGDTLSAATVKLNKNNTIVNVEGNSSIAGLTSGAENPAQSAITATGTDKVLTLNGTGTYEYKGKIGTGNYISSAVPAEGNFSGAANLTSTAVSISKTGSGTQTFSGAVNLHDVEISAGSLNLTATSTVGTAVVKGGSLSLSGTSTVGTAVVEGGSLSLSGTSNGGSYSTQDAGSIDVGVLTISSGTLSLSGEGIVLSKTLTNNATLSVNNVTINDLSGFEFTTGTLDTTKATGMQSVGSLYTLVKGTGTATGTVIYNNQSYNITDGISDASNVYYVAAGDEATSTDEAAATANAFMVNGTLTVNGDTNGNLTASDILASSTGSGDLVLATETTLSGATATQMTGTLVLQDRLNFGSNGGNNADTVSIASFNAVELDGGDIYIQNDAATLKNVTVTANGGAIHSQDMGAKDAGKLIDLTGTTTLNGDLTISTHYNAQMQIAKLTGTGNLVFDGAANNEELNVNILGAEDYEGIVKVASTPGNSLMLTIAENAGINVLYTATNNKAISLSLIGAGNTVTMQGAKGWLTAGTIAADIVLKNTSNLAALEVGEGSTGAKYTFTGKVQDSGNIVINKDLGAGKMTFEFSGDVESWTGNLVVIAGNSDLTFTGDATSIKNAVIAAATGNADKKTKLTFSHESAATVDSEITNNYWNRVGTLDIEVTNTDAAGTTFSKGIKANSLKVTSGTQVTLTGEAVVDTLTTEGTVKLTGEGSVTYGGTTTVAAPYTGYNTEAAAATITSDAITGGTVSFNNAEDVTESRVISDAGIYKYGAGTANVAVGDENAAVWVEEGNLAMTAANGATSVAEMTIAAGAQVSTTGNLTVTDALTIIGDAATPALSVTGALTLAGAEINLTNLTLQEGVTSYTLGTVTSGDIDTTGVSLTFGADQLAAAGFEGYTATVGASATDATALVLTLTAPEQPDPDQPEPPVVTPLTEITITGGTYADNVLTFTTTDDIVNATFGDTLNATMTEEVWEAIVGATTLPDSVLVSITDGQGNYIDVDTDNNGEVDMALTINGEGVNGPAVVQGDGTIVGNYVTSYIPEPTTTTLSLLALAGLAVRRRRK